MITISNAGQAITGTNYWDSPHAKSGLYFASWNAGALRLLVPDNQAAAIAEMLTGPRCIVTRGKLNGASLRAGAQGRRRRSLATPPEVMSMYETALKDVRLQKGELETKPYAGTHRFSASSGAAAV